MQLARALIHDPPIMLLDEPTRGLDVFGSQAIFEYIGQLRQEGRAVIVTTHRLDEAQRLCDRFGLMHRGRFVLEGTLEELRQQERPRNAGRHVHSVRPARAMRQRLFAVSDEAPRRRLCRSGGSP